MKRFQYVLGVGLVAVALGGCSLLPGSRTPTPEPTPVPEATTKSEEAVPTLTDEEIKIVENIETSEVRISTTKAKPAAITVKPHDQVQFFNDTGETITVVGAEGWGNVPLLAGENLTQSFPEAGTYTYTIKEFPAVKGTVVVR